MQERLVLEQMVDHVYAMAQTEPIAGLLPKIPPQRAPASPQLRPSRAFCAKQLTFAPGKGHAALIMHPIVDQPCKKTRKSPRIGREAVHLCQTILSP